MPTRFLINQCQIITFLILKCDIIENSRIESRGIVLPVQVGGLLGGPKGMLAPPLKLLGGPGPPLFLRLCTATSRVTTMCSFFQSLLFFWKNKIYGCHCKPHDFLNRSRVLNSNTVKILNIGTCMSEQSDQDLHCLLFFPHLSEALLQCKIKLFYIKDNYGSWSGCPNL